MIDSFRSSIGDSKKLRLLYRHCVEELKLPGDYGDLLRMAFLYCLSALDKLIHDIIVHEMVEIFAERRPPTPKYCSETISLDHHLSLVNSSMPPPELVFENIIRLKLSHHSFMDPGKLSEGLSLVWLESHKWQTIATAMGRDQDQVKTELRNLFKRRNAIVHEADKDPVNDNKLTIQPEDAERAENFISILGEEIHRLVL